MTYGKGIILTSPDSETWTVRSSGTRDCMIIAGWYGDAIAGSGNEQSGRRIKCYSGLVGSLPAIILAGKGKAALGTRLQAGGRFSGQTL
jgi:hypothetical protein